MTEKDQNELFAHMLYERWPGVLEVRAKLIDLGPRGQFIARSDIEDVLNVARKILEAR
jgi:hypothetical protein